MQFQGSTHLELVGNAHTLALALRAAVKLLLPVVVVALTASCLELRWPGVLRATAAVAAERDLEAGGEKEQRSTCANRAEEHPRAAQEAAVPIPVAPSQRAHHTR